MWINWKDGALGGTMKIRGEVNIMGMKEVIFRNKSTRKGEEPLVIVRYEKNDEYGKYEGEWLRIDLDFNPENMMYRTNENIMSTIKALALNPTVELTFNDGAMYVDFKPKKYKFPRRH